MEEVEIHRAVRNGYAQVAKQATSCCGGRKVKSAGLSGMISKEIGYSDEELKSVPDGANMGLGCGNPVALASLKAGETVLDLGSGGGFDCFLAAAQVGKTGRVIGVDMTPEMIDKARRNAKKGGYENVEFRLGEIENMPVADNSVEVIISNCVINLSPDKNRVFREAFRVLKPGGRLRVSDMVSVKDLPDYIKNSMEMYVGCLGGALRKDEYILSIKNAGFNLVKIVGETSFPLELMANDPTVQKIVKNLKIPKEMLTEISTAFVSIKVNGIKPLTN